LAALLFLAATLLTDLTLVAVRLELVFFADLFFFVAKMKSP